MLYETYQSAMRRKEKTENSAKPFVIDRHWVWEAYKAVKRNKGCAGVDKIDFKRFDKRMEDNLYKLWNRMSSGSYMPEPVLQVEIPKSNGGKRPLGIPTILDRIAQMTVVMQITPRLEAIFHSDSYGYRPARSSDDAIKTAHERCFRYEWVLDMDISKFFDTIDHELLMKAAKKIKETMKSWKLHSKLQWQVNQIAEEINPQVRGWYNYYTKFGRTEFWYVMKHLNDKLAQWAIRKYKEFKKHPRKAYAWLERLSRRERSLFAHLSLGYLPQCAK